MAPNLLASCQFLGAEPGHLVDIGAGRERPFAGASEDHGLDVVIGFVMGQRLVEFAHQREAQRIELVRAVQGDDCDTIKTLGQSEFISHVLPLLGR